MFIYMGLQSCRQVGKKDIRPHIEERNYVNCHKHLIYTRWTQNHNSNLGHCSLIAVLVVIQLTLQCIITCLRLTNLQNTATT